MSPKLFSNLSAVVYYEYGSPDVLQLEEIETPVPADDEILIKIEAASVNSGDWHILRADPFMIRAVSGPLKPKHRILGTDVSGRVEAVGSSVSRFHIGDEVFGDVSRCGFGAFAEYVCVPEKEAIILKPDSLTFEQAAAVPSAAVTALQALRNKGHIEPGQNVLINGASGGVGSYAVQLAKSFGAEVTGVCSTGKVDMVSSLGADHIIDYTKEDFSQNGLQYDLIHAANGYHSISQYKGSLKPNGT